MKKALFLPTTFLAFATLSQAQPAALDWVLPFDQPTTVASKEVVALPNGNALWIGNFLNAVDLDLGLGGPALSTPARGSFFGELTTTGAVVNAFGLECTGFIYSHAMIHPTTGGRVLFGYFQGTMDMDPSVAVNNLVSAGEYNAFVIALSADNELQWGHRIGGSGFDEVSIATMDAAGNIYLSGRYSNNVDFDPGPEVHSLNASSGSTSRYVLKLDQNGSFQWVRRLYNVGDIMLITSLLAHPNGDIYLTGAFSGNVDLDPGADAHSVSSEGSEADPFFLRWSGAGDFVWARIFSAAGPQSCFGALANDGSILLAIGLSQTVDIDPGSGTTLVTSAGDYDACLAQFNEDGELGWWHQWGGLGSDAIASLTVDQFGQIHVLNGLTGSVDLDPTSGVLTLGAGSAGFMALSTFGMDGSFHGALQLGSGANCSCQVEDIASLMDGSLVMAGAMQGTCDMDPSDGVSSLQDLGFQRRYLLRLLQASGTGMNQRATSASFDLFPNPAHEVLHVRSSETSATSAVIVDVVGKPVAMITLSGPETTLDVSGLKPGLYLLRTPGGAQPFMVQ